MLRFYFSMWFTRVSNPHFAGHFIHSNVLPQFLFLYVKYSLVLIRLFFPYYRILVGMTLRSYVFFPIIMLLESCASKRS
jgi:hypothetical protein